MTQTAETVRQFTITVQRCEECPVAKAYVGGVMFCSFNTKDELTIGQRIKIHQENELGLVESCPACPRAVFVPVEAKEFKESDSAFSFSGSCGHEVMQSIIDRLGLVQAEIIKKKIDLDSGCFYVLADCLRSDAQKISKDLKVDAYQADFNGKKWIISMTALVAKDAVCDKVHKTAEAFSFFGYGKGDGMRQAAEYLQDEGVDITKKIYVEGQHSFEIQGYCSQEFADNIKAAGTLVVEKINPEASP